MIFKACNGLVFTSQNISFTMKDSTIIDFDNFDKLSLKPFCEGLETYLMIDHEFVDGSLVASLNSRFGSGKTTFLEMWENDLRKRREKDDSLPQCIILNAWENDYCGDPLLSIITGLLTIIENTKTEPHLKEEVRDAAKKAAWFMVGLANSFISSNLGIDPIAAEKFTKEKGNKEKIPDFVTIYEDRTSALEDLKEALKSAFEGNDVKAIILVDELDRCRPDFAIQYIETIKHIFDIPGLVFVLAVDNEQLKSSVESLFGKDTNVEEYLRKFVHRNFNLPKPEPKDTHNLCETYIEKYLKNELIDDNGKKTTRRKSYDLIGEKNIHQMNVMISGLSLVPRQVQEIYRTVAHVVGGDNLDKKEGNDMHLIGLFLLVILKTSKQSVYERIENGVDCNLEMGRLFIKLVGQRRALSWIDIFLTGSGMKAKDIGGYNALRKELGYPEEGVNGDISPSLSEKRAWWGEEDSEKNHLQWICERIEHAMTF